MVISKLVSVLDEQICLTFSGETSLKVVQEYRAKYAWIDECLDANPLIRADTPVIEAKVHYPTDSSLLWDSYRVL
ncbi:hypothetical protein [Anaerobaca lacustris]|uniref:Uncharacterized protein n=1 Tax=Anaerobaca lacustris TaxID=3044600 RepID=A0AAW6U1V2_9BACT|nr:hypothetical protein [Sedimentisphaerales bacterium M17dextr]